MDTDTRTTRATATRYMKSGISFDCGICEGVGVGSAEAVAVGLGVGFAGGLGVGVGVGVGLELLFVFELLEEVWVLRIMLSEYVCEIKPALSLIWK